MAKRSHNLRSLFQFTKFESHAAKIISFAKSLKIILISFCFLSNFFAPYLKLKGILVFVKQAQRSITLPSFECLLSFSFVKKVMDSSLLCSENRVPYASVFCLDRKVSRRDLPVTSKVGKHTNGKRKHGRRTGKDATGSQSVLR